MICCQVLDGKDLPAIHATILVARKNLQPRFAAAGGRFGAAL
jgi:hypothetical protein